MRIILVLMLSIFLFFALYQSWVFFAQSRELKEEVAAAQAEANKALAENQALQEDYNFYSDPVNMEKELRARFNYREPGERMIIMVPPNGQP